MGWGRFRNWWRLLVTGAAALGAGWLLYLLFRSRDRDSLSTYVATAMPVVLLALGWLAWAWRTRKTARPSPASGEALNQAADHLAAAAQAQWSQAAEDRELTGADPVRVTWRRPSRPVAGPPTAATSSHRFDPLPGLAATTKANLAAGDTTGLHALYGGLRSGRLIITGPPGSGKTGAAVLLVLAALRHRAQVPAEQRPDVPVPVLFTAQDWNPKQQPAADWLTGKLQDAYPLLFTVPNGTQTAAALLSSGKITVILDGLDEISPELLPAALQALSHQTFRLVLLSRTTELAVAAASHGILRGAAAIHLNAVAPADAAAYLQRTQLDPPPPGWQELTRRVRKHPGSPLSKALSSPLGLSLVRDTYQADTIHELLQYCDTLTALPLARAADAVTGHLLDRVVPAAYTPRPGQPKPPYDVETARRTLTAIAARMNRDTTRDLSWWQIPKWASPASRALVSTLAPAAVFGSVVGVMVGLRVGLTVGLTAGLGVGAVAARVGGVAAFSGERPRMVGDLRLSKTLTLQNLVIVIAAVLGGALANGLIFMIGRGLANVLGAGLVTGIGAGLGGALANGLVFGLTLGIGLALIFGIGDVLNANPASTSTLTPATSWKRNRNYGRVAGLVIGLALALAGALAGVLVVGLAAGLALGLALGVVFGVLMTEIYSVSLASVLLALQWGVPVRLMKFLDDAHKRNVLRTVGPSYQFRHARLQDRLAAAASPGEGSTGVSASDPAAPVTLNAL